MEKPKRSVWAFTSFILGLASVVPGWGVYIGGAAILLAIVALIRIRTTGETGAGLAKWAIGLVIVWRVIWQLIGWATGFFFATGHWLPM